MHFAPYAKETFVILAGYALGCFTAGYYLVRWRTGEDIRLLGSGNVGATNVGRVLGRPGFMLTVLLDFLKGVVAVWLASYFQLKPEAVMLTMLGAACGHIWPMQLWFRGGKGVATSLGAILMFDYLVALIFSGLFLVLFGAVRNFVLAGLLAFAIMPLALFLLGFPLTSVFGLSALAVLILIAHRKNIREEMSKVMSDGKMKSDKRAVSK